MACAPMKRKAILRVLHSTDCPSSAYQEVLVNVAQSLLEVQQRDAGEIAAVVTQDAALFIIGAAFDGAEIGPSVRALIDEWALYSTPKVHGTARNPGTNGTNGTTIEVVSLTDKEARDKYITLQGTKLWRNSSRPFKLLYCHHWVGKTCGGYEVWKAMFREFVGETTENPVHRLRNEAVDRIVGAWFDITRACSVPEDLSAAQVELFQSAADLLAEGFLLRKGVKLSATATVATATFAHALQKRRHSGTVIDYFSDIQESQTAKDAPLGGCYRRQPQGATWRLLCAHRHSKYF